MVRAEINVPETKSLHSRSAAMLVQVTCSYSSRVTLERGDKSINGKSMMGVLSLDATPGDTITIIADGIDEQLVVDALSKLIRTGFAGDGSDAE